MLVALLEEKIFCRCLQVAIVEPHIVFMKLFWHKNNKLIEFYPLNDEPVFKRSGMLCQCVLQARLLSSMLKIPSIGPRKITPLDISLRIIQRIIYPIQTCVKKIFGIYIERHPLSIDISKMLKYKIWVT